MQRFLLTLGFIALSILFLLVLSTDNSSRLAPYFWYIGGACLALIAAMIAVILRYIWLIVRDRRSRVFGSRIARRLSLAFTLAVMVPALLLLLVSGQMITRTIHSWFGDDTREALERSLKLSRSALDGAVRKTTDQAGLLYAELTAASLQNRPQDALQTARARQFSHVAVWEIKQQPQLVSESNPLHLRQPELDAETLTHIRMSGKESGVENINGTLYAGGWLALPERNGKRYALFFRQPVPANTAQDAQLIEAAWSKYAELVFANRGLQTFFVITLALTTVLASLVSLALALYFARRFVEPILLLAEGAQAVAHGNFSRRITVTRRDELGRLTEQFNHMTEQLAIAKVSDELHRKEQEAARHYLERVLDSLSSGVITLDRSGCLNTYNQSAESILALPLRQLIGHNRQNWADLSPQHHTLAEVFNRLLASEESGSAIEIAYPTAEDERILQGLAVRLPEENGKGIVLIFDNITNLVMAQKEAAWGEIAKRLAHEIRNPLTPIQLSAERLARKLHGKLAEADEQILQKSTDTIVKQVAALQVMVEAFRNYARSSGIKRLSNIDLNVLIEEILVLYESTPCRFSADLDGHLPELKADNTAMRQVLHNLLKNAAEAAAADAEPQVHIRTFVENGQIALEVCNNGQSFSKHMLQHAFEPYVTDKAGGTGLGLPVVKKIIEEQHGRIALSNRQSGGACVSITLPPAQETNESCETPTS